MVRNFISLVEIDLPEWNQSEWNRIKAVVKVTYTAADEFVCDIDDAYLIEVEGVELGVWKKYPAKEVAEQIGCSIHKLGDLCMEAVESEVYQRVIEGK